MLPQYTIVDSFLQSPWHGHLEVLVSEMQSRFLLFLNNHHFHLSYVEYITIYFFVYNFFPNS